MLLGITYSISSLYALQDSHLLRSGFPAAFRLRHDTPGLMASTQHVPSTPQMQRRQLSHIYGLGSSPFARRYSGNRLYFLFLRLLRCFSSPAYLSRAYPPGMQVLPFGYPGITGPVHLPRAFRSLARPSSAPAA